MNHPLRAIGRAGLGAAALLLAVAGCAGGQVTDADIQTLSHERLRELRSAETPQNVVLIDVRSPADYRQGHIAGAINIPLPELRRGDPRLTRAGWRVVYARDWGTGLATAAAKKLIALGYANVFVYREGLRQWQEEGGEVVEGEQRSEEGEASR